MAEKRCGHFLRFVAGKSSQFEQCNYVHGHGGRHETKTPPGLDESPLGDEVTLWGTGKPNDFTIRTIRSFLKAALPKAKTIRITAR